MGSYDSMALFLADFTNLRQVGQWPRRLRADHSPRTSLPDLPHTSPPNAVFKMAGGGGAMMATATTATVTTATATTTTTTTVAAAKKATTTYGDGDDVYDGDGRR
jgi:hypothetical protein